jgi:hypothetical protein
MNNIRPTVPQQVDNQVVAVGTAPTPLSSNPALTSAYIDAFLICLYTTAANSVFFGNGGVTITNGVEIPPGVSVQFAISNERELYELQTPLELAAAALTCQTVDHKLIPFVYWDLSQLFLVAAAATNVVVMPFKRAYV